MASHHGVVAHLLPQAYKRMVAEWLEEDCPSFDYGGFVVGEKLAEATLLGKSAVSSALCMNRTYIQILLRAVYPFSLYYSWLMRSRVYVFYGVKCLSILVEGQRFSFQPNVLSKISHTGHACGGSIF